MPLSGAAVLRDGDTTAAVLPDVGANCVSFEVGGRAVLEPVLSIAEVLARPAWAGCPVLFPFPGRVEAARYVFDGIAYTLPANSPDGQGHHVHGFVSRARWRVLERSASTITCGFDHDMLPAEAVAGYPWPFSAHLALVGAAAAVAGRGCGPQCRFEQPAFRIRVAPLPCCRSLGRGLGFRRRREMESGISRFDARCGYRADAFRLGYGRGRGGQAHDSTLECCQLPGRRRLAPTWSWRSLHRAVHQSPGCRRATRARRAACAEAARARQQLERRSGTRRLSPPMDRRRSSTTQVFGERDATRALR
jgi:hypothetical protein